MICPKCEFKNAFETNRRKHKYVDTYSEYFNYCPNCDNVWTDARQEELNREFLEKEIIRLKKGLRN